MVGTTFGNSCFSIFGAEQQRRKAGKAAPAVLLCR